MEVYVQCTFSDTCTYLIYADNCTMYNVHCAIGVVEYAAAVVIGEV